MTDRQSILEVRDLTAEIATRREVVQAVRGISFDIGRGESVGFVGESGCGKSVTARAVMRLAAEGTRISLGGSVRFDGKDILRLDEAAMRDIRGRRIAMVFQDPMTSLNPVMTIGSQIDDMLRRHTALTGRAVRERTIDLLDQVGIVAPARRADDHPHQFSGGMRQRVLIAMAISCDPDLLIADEPTTALDVTVQAQILRLLMRLREERGMSLMLITHDFGVVAGMVEKVNVMYRGEIVETGGVEEILTHPNHEYTRALLEAVPRLDTARRRQ
ncbi:ABC transporter ATP-binding protein [Arvimicrobium flavum]|uniref:ABC transporter ATP-binding protein n=1 Tax=Arvimicrobium flavum TaxID=3393320 RepID=UPI00237A6739|nr:ABC transporter ATP-binding protein [Mesorhizobium shangrilense]